MAYTSEDKVKAIFRKINIDASNSALTPTELTIFIDEAEAEMNGVLFDYYTVPITGVESLKIVSKISTLKVAHLIMVGPLKDMHKKLEGEGNLMDLGKMAQDLLDKLIPEWDAKNESFKKAKVRLYDAAAKDYGPGKGSKFRVSTPTGDPIFKKGVDSW